MFNFSKKEKKPENIKEVLKILDGLEDRIESLSEELENLKKKSKFCVQKMGVVRYNPFSNIGSDQSFSIALLDANNNGAVITSIYAREGNRVYAKPIKNSSSDYSLSDEEKESLKKAMG